ncbi:uncharacterized protein LY79DRAFT_270780 [Colletotrichum navitas]|uniref:Uncharacterized protein n=1 Tax=Colletotrichum navitas TaxID=681940 RepID=A0AAD8PW83_9PEZI|nr:uncharacterized protein LY79DRAFT_270780 [Colletotrichum navitas]KAK1585331.1 hypothetical protein LY79DRAFT_270780 [Colletotrichum navitas]
MHPPIGPGTFTDIPAVSPVRSVENANNAYLWSIWRETLKLLHVYMYAGQLLAAPRKATSIVDKLFAPSFPQNLHSSSSLSSTSPINSLIAPGKQTQAAPSQSCGPRFEMPCAGLSTARHLSPCLERHRVRRLPPAQHPRMSEALGRSSSVAWRALDVMEV